MSSPSGEPGRRRRAFSQAPDPLALLAAGGARGRGLAAWADLLRATGPGYARQRLWERAKIPGRALRPHPTVAQ